MTETLRKFICDHAEDDLSELLLSADRYKGVDMKSAVRQIQARTRMKEKLPDWYREERIYYPSVLATEQCSSKWTALYKQRLVREVDVLCDLTGGLGVDACFFSKKVKRVIYVEKKADYCNAARYNMPLLGASGVEVVQADAMDLVRHHDRRIADADVFYLDPDRRGTGNKRMFALQDCEPDLTLIAPLLCAQRRRLIAKLSPMLDLTQVLKQIPGVCEIHVVSVKNDCKELLIVVRQDAESALQIFCVNYTADGVEQSFQFDPVEEKTAVVPLAKYPGQYLYEPNASVLKAGAYKLVAVRLGIEKLHVSSHLYTSAHFTPLFPGRIFKVDEIIPFNSRTCKHLSADIPQGNIAVRNFPLSVDALRKRTRIADGGDFYLFATTLSDNQKVLIKCHKAIG